MIHNICYLPDHFPDKFIRILFGYMIFQQDVHALKKFGSQPVKDDDDIVVFRRSTLTVSCQLGANSPETDVSVSSRWVPVLPFLVKIT